MASDRQRRALERVAVYYNTDYDEELKELSGTDVSAVAEAAAAVADAVARAGYGRELHGVHGLDLAEHFDRLVRDPPDLVFNLVESLNGTTRNEPLFPSVLDMLSIPYTGPGALPLRLCLDKDRTREILAAADVAIPAGATVRDLADLDTGSLASFETPMFVKLAREDASIGIAASNVCETPAALRSRAGELLEKYKQPLIVERFIEGREVNVTVMGNGDSISTLPLHEIDFGAMPAGSPHIVSYAAKWDEDHPDYAGTLPVPLVDSSPDLASAIIDTAVSAFQALELCDFGRVDLRIDAAGAPHVIDINPNCDLSPDAGVARAAKVAGLDYHELIGQICETAWGRAGEPRLEGTS